MLCLLTTSKGTLIDDRLQYRISFMKSSILSMHYDMLYAYIKLKLVITELM